MEQGLEKLVGLFRQINDNGQEMDKRWKNLKLAQEAFEMFVAMPLRCEGELTPYSRVVLMHRMMDCVSELDIPRFSLKVRRYQLEMLAEEMLPEDIKTDMAFDSYEGKAEEYEHRLTADMVKNKIEKLEDYISPTVTMDEFDKKYGRHLRHDPVESSEAWERNIYEVEKECDRKLEGEPRGMGFCFGYWSVKGNALRKRGIDWRSPHAMNPRVMFD